MRNALRIKTMEIKAEHLSKYYQNGRFSAKGLDDATLTIPDGSFVLIKGESGSGKSTLLKVLTLQAPFDEGDLFLDGENSDLFGERKRFLLFRDRMAYVPSDGDLIEGLSALDNCVLPLLAAGTDFRSAKRKARSCLALCGISGKAGRKPKRLSGGERIRVSVARAVASGKEVLAFDEVTGNLDKKSADEVVRLVLSISEGRTILWVSHSPEGVASCASEIITLSGGKIAIEERGGRDGNPPARPRAGEGNASKPKGLAWLMAKLALGRPGKTAADFLSSFLLAASLILSCHFSSFVSKEAMGEAQVDYTFSSRMGNRLLVESSSSGEPVLSLPTSSFCDQGNVFGDLFFKASLGSRAEQKFTFPSRMAVQPILPPEAAPIMGSSGEDGFYLLIGDSSIKRGQLDFDVFEKHIGETFSLYESSLFSSGFDVAPCHLRFSGAYFLSKASFYSDGNDYSMYIPTPSIPPLRDYLLRELSAEKEGAMGKSAVYEGNLKPSGMRIGLGDGTFSELLTKEDYVSKKTQWESANQKAFPEGGVAFAESFKNAPGPFLVFRGSRIPLSSFGTDEVRYLGWPFRDGDCYLSDSVLKSKAVSLSLESSLFFESEEKLAEAEAAAAGAGMISRRASEGAATYPSGDSESKGIALLVGAAALAFSLLVYLLTRAIGRKFFRRGASERLCLLHNGFPRLWIRIGESASLAVSYLLFAPTLLAAYAWLVPGAKGLLSGRWGFFAGSLAAFFVLALMPPSKGEK
jgi:putative ABC transport system ATP-binding protein